MRLLVIDQPEDEVDNRLVSDTLLPVLRKLAGRRQMIAAAQNPNVVVNEDADMVYQVETDARRVRIGCTGAIEEPAVRNSIVRAVDGAREALCLRRREYGF